MTELDFENLADQIAKVEGTRQNPRSNARGVGQFMPDTWLRTVKAHYNTNGMTDAQILQLRDDPQTARAVLGSLVRDNAAALQSYGHNVTPGNVYLANHFGPAGAHALLSADPSAPLSAILTDPLILKQNPDLKGKTVGQVIGSDAAKVGGDDLAAMGLSAPGNPKAPAAADELGGTGFAIAPVSEIDKARGDLGMVKANVPAGDQIVQGINGIVANGLKAGKDASQIKRDLADFQASNGLDPTQATGIDDFIAYKQKGGAGPVPIMKTQMVKPAGTADNAMAGVKQGVEDVDATFVKPAAKLGVPLAQDYADKLYSDRALFDATAGNTTAGNLGRLGGNVAASAVPIGAANSLIARGAGQAAAWSPVAADAVEFLGGRGGGNLLTRGASLATNGALQGGEGALAVSGDNDAPLSDQIGAGLATGGVLGPAGALVGAGTNAIVRAVAPRVDPAVATLAQKANRFQIPVRGSQISGSPFVRGLDSVLSRVPGSGMTTANDAQRDAFTSAVGRTFGADSARLTPEVMTEARDRIGQVFDNVARRTPISVDDQFINDLASIENDAHQVVTNSEMAPLSNQLNNVLQKVRGSGDGLINGETYQALTRKGAPLERAMSSSDPNVAHYAGQIRDALDSALERSAAPEDIEALRNARFQYKNLKTVEPLVAKSTDGTISPALLKGRVAANFKNSAYSGAGDLGDLANIGQRFLKEQSSSNTAERSQQFNMLMNIAKVGGGGALTLLGVKAGVSPAEILALAGTGGSTMGAANLTGRYLRSDAYRNRLISAALNNDIPAAGSTWFNRNYVPLAVAGSNPLLLRSNPRGQGGAPLSP